MSSNKNVERKTEHLWRVSGLPASWKMTGDIVTKLRSSCSPLENQYPRERQVVVERKVAFHQKAGNLGRRQTHTPKTNSEDSAQP